MAFLVRKGTPLNAPQPLVNIERPRHRLSVFAVADNVDPGLRLQAHGFRDRLLETELKARDIIHLVIADLSEVIDERRRSDQASDMRYGNPAVSS